MTSSALNLKKKKIESWRDERASSLKLMNGFIKKPPVATEVFQSDTLTDRCRFRKSPVGRRRNRLLWKCVLWLVCYSGRLTTPQLFYL